MVRYFVNLSTTTILRHAQDERKKTAHGDPSSRTARSGLKVNRRGLSRACRGIESIWAEKVITEIEANLEEFDLAGLKIFMKLPSKHWKARVGLREGCYIIKSNHPNQVQLSQSSPIVSTKSNCSNKVQLFQPSPIVPIKSNCSNQVQLSQSSPIVSTKSNCSNQVQLSQSSPIVSTKSNCPNQVQSSWAGVEG